MAQLTKMPYTIPNEPPGPIKGNLGTVHKPKENPFEAHNPRCAYYTINWPKYY